MFHKFINTRHNNSNTLWKRRFIYYFTFWTNCNKNQNRFCFYYLGFFYIYPYKNWIQHRFLFQLYLSKLYFNQIQNPQMLRAVSRMIHWICCYIYAAITILRHFCNVSARAQLILNNLIRFRAKDDLFGCGCTLLLVYFHLINILENNQVMKHDWRDLNRAFSYNNSFFLLERLLIELILIYSIPMLDPCWISKSNFWLVSMFLAIFCDLISPPPVFLWTFFFILDVCVWLRVITENFKIFMKAS